MKIIGLTGGIGSGKTIVGKVFQSLGIPVFNSDYYAKKVYDDFPETMDQLRQRYGEGIIQDGKIDKAKLASIVFESEEELSALNKLVHPFVKKQFDDWCKLQDSKYLIREAAILFESGTSQDCDSVVLVTSPLELRVKRTMQRDQISEEQVMARISRQWSDAKKRVLSQFEITNDDKSAILPQILAIHEQILKG